MNHAKLEQFSYENIDEFNSDEIRCIALPTRRAAALSHSVYSRSITITELLLLMLLLLLLLFKNENLQRVMPRISRVFMWFIVRYNKADQWLQIGHFFKFVCFFKFILCNNCHRYLFYTATVISSFYSRVKKITVQYNTRFPLLSTT